MSEKVVLTREQAEAIEKIKKFKEPLGNIIAFEEEIKMQFPTLFELTFDETAKALYIGYEIEPKMSNFKTGDKVIGINTAEIYTLKHRKPEKDEKGHGKAWGIEGVHWWAGEKQIRHATPEEIYWVEMLGREKVGDFKLGDIFVDDENYIFSVDKTNQSTLMVWYKEAKFKGIYPSESFKPFSKEESK